MSNVIKLSRVLEKTTLGRSTLYAYMERGAFPPAVRVSERNVVWVESEVDAWLQDRIKNSRISHAEAVPA